MKTLEQTVCKNCFYENELPDCPKLCPLTFEHVKKWLQQKQQEIKLKHEGLKSKYIDELLEELE